MSRSLLSGSLQVLYGAFELCADYANLSAAGGQCSGSLIYKCDGRGELLPEPWQFAYAVNFETHLNDGR